MKLHTVAIGGALLVAVAVVRKSGAEQPKPRRVAAAAKARDARVQLPPRIQTAIRSAKLETDAPPAEPTDEFIEDVEVIQYFDAEGAITDAKTGAVQGTVSDAANGERLVGVTVVAMSPALPGEQVALTDENGFYRITDLPPGEYTIVMYYNDHERRHHGVQVTGGRTTSELAKLTLPPPGAGITIETEYLVNIPTGRTFEAVLSESDARGDEIGVSFTGTESLENNYFVDGIDTTGLKFGD